MLDWIGTVAQALTFAALWRQVLLLTGALVYGAVCWAAFRNPKAKPFTRRFATLGGLVIFAVLPGFVFLKGA